MSRQRGAGRRQMMSRGGRRHSSNQFQTSAGVKIWRYFPSFCSYSPLCP
ncbi:MAG: hypothetical protein LBL82_07205 [Oscillospiraceae bacterium]|nr:hypothetical protein [Oscillospiraceae bacterium]